MILWSLLPLLLAGGLALGAGLVLLGAGGGGVRATLESWSLIEALLQWLEADRRQRACARCSRR